MYIVLGWPQLDPVLNSPVYLLLFVDFWVIHVYELYNFSGHCVAEEDKLCSPKTYSAATSPIKDPFSLRYGSREMAKKLVNRDVQTEKYGGHHGGGLFHSSSSSEKVVKS